MQLDLRTVSITPLRHTFDHIAARLGADKPATRYQEGTFDLQSTHNQHYRPTWDPGHELYDAGRTAIVMRDWYALKDPRQYYYGAYTIARARQQEATEANFEFVDSRGLAESLPDDVRRAALDLLVPLRHAAFGANLNHSAIAAYGYGTAVTQAAMYQAMDQLGIAQYLTRVAMLLAGTPALHAGRVAWLEAPRWQELRRLTENTFVLEDWFELFVAQNLCVDGLLYPLVYEHLVDRHLTARGGACVAMLTAFMTGWHEETGRWVDAVVRTAAAESDANRERLRGWALHWRERALAALAPIVAHALGEHADALLAATAHDFDVRLRAVGLAT